MKRGGDGKLKGKRSRIARHRMSQQRLNRLMRRGGIAAEHMGSLYVGLGMMVYPFEGTDWRYTSRVPSKIDFLTMENEISKPSQEDQDILVFGSVEAANEWWAQWA